MAGYTIQPPGSSIFLHSVKVHWVRTTYSPDTDCVLPYKAIRSPYLKNTGSSFGRLSRFGIYCEERRNNKVFYREYNAI